MPLEPVHHVLTDLRKTQWQQQRQFGQLVQAWANIVGPAVAAQTQPMQMTAQRVLIVATASAVWAQNLAFERQRILTKLNALLEQPLTDLKFSTSQWRLGSSKKRVKTSRSSWTPKTLVPRSQSQSREPANAFDSSKAAFEHWSHQVRSHSQNNPPCPQCHCATPIAELQRWSVCGLCWVRPQNNAPASNDLVPPPPLDP